MYTFDQDLNMYYDDVNNVYMTPEEYLIKDKIECEHCGVLLFKDEICWCLGG